MDGLFSFLTACWLLVLSFCADKWQGTATEGPQFEAENESRDESMRSQKYFMLWTNSALLSSDLATLYSFKNDLY